MNEYIFTNGKVKRKVRARTEAGARGRLPKKPGQTWKLSSVIKPPPHPDAIPIHEAEKVPLTWGVGGPTIGTATVRNDGQVEMVVDRFLAQMDSLLFSDVKHVSIEGTIAPHIKGE